MTHGIQCSLLEQELIFLLVKIAQLLVAFGTLMDQLVTNTNEGLLWKDLLVLQVSLFSLLASWLMFLFLLFLSTEHMERDLYYVSLFLHLTVFSIVTLVFLVPFFPPMFPHVSMYAPLPPALQCLPLHF